MNYVQLKENLENETISYDNLVKLVNNDKDITICDFMGLMNDTISEKIDVEDFTVIEDYISTIRSNIEKELNTDSYTDYSYNPSENGGIYTNSLILNNPDLGLLGDLLTITTVAEIRIDFRPDSYTYVGVHFLNDEVARDSENRSILGVYKYLHYEVNNDGELLNSSLESM